MTVIPIKVACSCSSVYLTRPKDRTGPDTDDREIDVRHRIGRPCRMTEDVQAFPPPPR